MRQIYQGLPAAANVEQAIRQAQLLILKDLERKVPPVPDVGPNGPSEDNGKLAA